MNTSELNKKEVEEMGLFKASLRSQADKKLARVNELRAIWQKFVDGETEADQQIAEITTQREAAMLAPGEDPPDLSVFDKPQKRAEEAKAWHAMRQPEASAAVAVARNEYREAERAVRWEEGGIVANKVQAAYASFVTAMNELLRYRDLVDLYDPTICPERYDAWVVLKERAFNPPVKVKAAELPKQVVRFIHNWDKYSGTPEGGDEACMSSEQEALDAVIAGAAVYVFDTPETRQLVAQAQEERARLKKYPGTRLAEAEDFPQQ